MQAMHPNVVESGSSEGDDVWNIPSMLKPFDSDTARDNVGNDVGSLVHFQQISIKFFNL
jgi:hypothetical protein